MACHDDKAFMKVRCIMKPSLGNVHGMFTRLWVNGQSMKRTVFCFFPDILKRCVTHIYTSSQQVFFYLWVQKKRCLKSRWKRCIIDMKLQTLIFSSLCPSCYYKQATQCPTGIASEQYSHLLPWICMVDTFFSGNQSMTQDEAPVAFCRMWSNGSHS